MLDITFLNKPKNFQVEVGGLEFMDYQKGDLFHDLVRYFDTELVNDNHTWHLKDRENSAEALKVIFMKHTGILLELQEESVGNAAVEAGWFSPNNVINIKGLENWFSASQTNIGQAFKAMKTDVLKGWVDTSTGMVGGDFSKIPFRLYMNHYISNFIRYKIVERYKVTMSEALAGILIHECGHVFTGFLSIYRTIVDPLVSTTAMKMIVAGKIYGKQRVDIIKEAFKLMEVSQPVKEEDVVNMTGDQLVIYFNKAINTRDMRRTLSLGTQDRSSEIYADLYSVRMGCGKSLVAALAAIPTGSLLFAGMSAAWLNIAIIGWAAMSPALMIVGGLFSLFYINVFFQNKLLPNDMYDSRYRRLKTILRDHIVQLNEMKGGDKRDKIKLLADAKEIEKMLDDNKPFLEGTAVQRVFGWLSSGNDFRAQDFENYTDELLGHTLSLYKDAF
ncbi:membrane protein [Kosakonia phage Kc263]|uniref:Membrane protein n=1 Tax=Kosakonia phage Kc263 TaxID=2863194 RepID=A0AAE7WFM9_9CAUD|nr:membrane protein [Kosakonia phage Kc263]QYN79995.1 membrane protein [Kosakonia phage Kc263]